MGNKEFRTIYNALNSNGNNALTEFIQEITDIVQFKKEPIDISFNQLNALISCLKSNSKKNRALLGYYNYIKPYAKKSLRTYEILNKTE